MQTQVTVLARGPAHRDGLFHCAAEPVGAVFKTFDARCLLAPSWAESYRHGVR
jgi:hypothetical protein